MKNKKAFWGLVLVVIGVLIALSRLNIMDFNLFFKGWWTLFIIVPSFFGLFDRSGRTFSFIMFLFGVLLLLNAQNILDIKRVSNLIFPGILVIIGFSMIINGCSNKKRIPKVNNKDEYYGIFSSEKINNDSKFNGCDLNAIFGSVELNVSDATIMDNSVVKVSSIFGSSKIIVADNVKVIINKTCLFGGIEDNTKTDKNSKDILYIEALCLFGGIRIDNGKE